jgi:ankyrin repeat protein
MALIDAGADVNQWDLFGRAPLFNAIDLNTLPIGGRPDIASDDSIRGIDVAKRLLEEGANPNMQLKVRPPYRNAIFDRGSDNVLANGATPLIRAARAADNEAVQLLLDHGALVDLPTATEPAIPIT